MAAHLPQVHSVIDRDGAAILDVERGLISKLNPTGGDVEPEGKPGGERQIPYRRSEAKMGSKKIIKIRA
jgi:hypothetical protein